MVQSRCGGQTYPQVHWILSWSSCSGVNVWNLKSTRKKWSIWVVKSRTAGDFLDIFLVYVYIVGYVCILYIISFFLICDMESKRL